MKQWTLEERSDTKISDTANVIYLIHPIFFLGLDGDL